MARVIAAVVWLMVQSHKVRKVIVNIPAVVNVYIAGGQLTEMLASS